MRLIDAEALENEIVKTMRYVPKDAVLDVACMVNRAPTIEAKPVVHAHWKPFIEDVEIYNTGGYREKRQTGWICSKCGKGFTEFGHTKYCSDCGAQMDFSEEKDE